MKTTSRKKLTHGGKRAGAGRTPEHGPVAMKVCAVRLTSTHIETARALGGGDLSAGIRGLLEAAVQK